MHAVKLYNSICDIPIIWAVSQSFVSSSTNIYLRKPIVSQFGMSVKGHA